MIHGQQNIRSNSNSVLEEQAGSAPFQTTRSPETLQFTPHIQNIFSFHPVFISHLLLYPIKDCRSLRSLSNLYYDLLFLYPVYMHCSLFYLYFAWSSTKYYVTISNNTVNFQPVFHTINKSPTSCIKAYNVAASDITPHRLNDFKYQDLNNHPFLTYIFFTYIIYIYILI
jgi:hypothetical protein